MQPRRLDQLLANLGYCSRGEARAWVRKGRVTVAGKVAKSGDEKASPELVQVDGEPLDHPGELLILLHKPAGYICTRDAAEGATIYELLPARWARRNPPITSVGRLDKDTTGVLLLTDQGDLVQRWTSPKHKVPKLYEVTVDRDLDPGLVPMFAAGTMRLEGEDKPCLPARLEIISSRTGRLELTEGRYHQVKRMFAAHGYTVTNLHRSRFGDVELSDLAVGQWRLLPRPAVMDK